MSLSELFWLLLRLIPGSLELFLLAIWARLLFWSPRFRALASLNSAVWSRIQSRIQSIINFVAAIPQFFRGIARLCLILALVTIAFVTVHVLPRRMRSDPLAARAGAYLAMVRSGVMRVVEDVRQTLEEALQEGDMDISRRVVTVGDGNGRPDSGSEADEHVEDNAARLPADMGDFINALLRDVQGQIQLRHGGDTIQEGDGHGVNDAQPPLTITADIPGDVQGETRLPQDGGTDKKGGRHEEDGAQALLTSAVHIPSNAQEGVQREPPPAWLLPHLREMAEELRRPRA